MERVRHSKFSEVIKFDSTYSALRHVDGGWMLCVRDKTGDGWVSVGSYKTLCGARDRAWLERSMTKRVRP